MIPVYLADVGSGHALHLTRSLVKPNQGDVLVVESQARTHGVFKTVQIAGASTNTVATPVPGGAIVITDIVVSAKKKASSTILVQWDDDVPNTEVMLAPDIVNNPANIVWQPAGLIRGWKDARVEVVTDATFDATVTVGYYHIDEALTYESWDALR